MENKLIVITIKPQHLCNILNGIKTIEIRKNKNLANAVEKVIAENGECHIKCACSKSKPYLNSLEYMDLKWFWLEDKDILGVTENSKKATNGLENGLYRRLNGYIVCEIVVDKVEEIRCSWGSNFIDWSKYPADERYDYYIGNEMDTCDICRVACLEMEKLDNYLKGKKGYALHIKSVIPCKVPQHNERVIQNFAYVEE